MVAYNIIIEEEEQKMKYTIEYGSFEVIKGCWIELKDSNNSIEQYSTFETKKQLMEKVRYYKNMYQIEKIIENL